MVMIIDFEKAKVIHEGAERTKQLLATAAQLPPCLERDLSYAVANSDWRKVNELLAQPAEKRHALSDMLAAH